jgi:quercetin dioxygenase-like cupin family protein
MNYCLFPAILLIFAGCFLQLPETTSVPVEEEPLHKVVFKNDAVTVMHLILPPGERTQYHTHTHDRIAIQLSATSTTNQDMGKPESAPSPTKPGDIGALTLAGASYTHRVHNVGKVPFDVLDIEPAERPATPSPELAAPVAAETPSARVYNWVLAAGATTPMHTHMRPYIIVAVTDMNLKMSSPDGQTATHPVGVGDFKYIDARITHNLCNAGTTPGQIIEVELK